MKKANNQSPRPRVEPGKADHILDEMLSNQGVWYDISDDFKSAGQARNHLAHVYFARYFQTSAVGGVLRARAKGGTDGN